MRLFDAIKCPPWTQWTFVIYCEKKMHMNLGSVCMCVFVFPRSFVYCLQWKLLLPFS